MSNPDNFQIGYLLECVFKNNLNGLKNALSRVTDPNERDSDGRTPLIHAVIDNKLDIAKLLLESGANANIQDLLGNTALHYAAQSYHVDMAILLLRYKATVDLTDNYGNTPLWRAVFYSRGRGDMIAVLLKAGADRNHQNKNGKSPLELAKNIANYNVAQYFGIP